MSPSLSLVVRRLKSFMTTTKDVQQIIREGKARDREEEKARSARARAAMKYRGLINIDFTSPNQNGYQKLIAALIQTGWVYLETSALHCEGDLSVILRSLEIVAKQCHDAGVLSALTLHIQ